MKKWIYLTAFCVLQQLVVYGAKPWPGVSWDYCKVYLYNLDNSMMGNHNPISNGKLKAGSISAEYILDKSYYAAINKWFSTDLSALEVGLSGCYIPHHALVFYNTNDEIVAWMSICFLCEGIRLYHPEPKSKPIKSISEKTAESASKHLQVLKSYFIESGIPVWNQLEEVSVFKKMLDGVYDTTFVRISDDMIFQRFVTKLPSYDDVIGFFSKEDSVSSQDYHLTGEDPTSKKRVVVKYKGSEYHFYTNQNHELLLARVSLTEQKGNFTNELLLGSLLDEFVGKKIVDKIHANALVEISDPYLKREMRLYFQNNKLKRIEIKF